MIHPDDIELPTLLPGQVCTINIFDTLTKEVTEAYRTAETLFEAPNWPHQDQLILNGEGVLWRFNLTERSLHRIDAPGLPKLNNDHVPSNDGDTIFVSAYDWHIHRVSLATGRHSRVTQENPARPMLHFLHGVSPDASELAFVGVEPAADHPFGPANIFTLPSDGGPARQLTFGDRPADGPEYSPDGKWIYFNTECFSKIPGAAQIARIRPDGQDLQQLTFDARVNWFPHLAPKGKLACYLSFEPGTTGHPMNRPVELKVISEDRWTQPVTSLALFGGQGTINVNSWSPDGRYFAFMAYPL